MDMTRDGQSPLFGSAAATDTPELVGDALVADVDRRSAADPLAGWISRLSIGEHVAGAIAAGQARAIELLNTTRRLRVSARAGAAALHNYGRSAAATTSGTFNKAGSMIRNAPEAFVDYLCIALMGGLALMGATDWDTRRDRLERYTLLPGEQPRYWGTPHYSPRPYSPQTPITFSANWQPASSHAASYPDSAPTAIPALYLGLNAGDPVSAMPAWLLPLYQQEKERAQAEQADLITRYLVQFVGASSDIFSAAGPHPAAPLTQRTGATREEREAPARRRIRVRIGSITMAFSGPTNDIYGQVSAWQVLHPESRIISDEPVAM